MPVWKAGPEVSETRIERKRQIEGRQALCGPLHAERAYVGFIDVEVADSGHSPQAPGQPWLKWIQSRIFSRVCFPGLCFCTAAGRLRGPSGRRAVLQTLEHHRLERAIRLRWRTNQRPPSVTSGPRAASGQPCQSQKILLRSKATRSNCAAASTPLAS